MERRKVWNRLAFVDGLSVDAGFRRKGMGRTLQQHVLIWAAANQ
jgi:GNAT superfamily N-acetyltransferase